MAQNFSYRKRKE